MSDQLKQEYINKLIRFAQHNNIECDTPEKLTELMGAYLKSELMFEKQFDKLPMSQKKQLLGIN